MHAARIGVSLKGCVAYVTWPPCTGCSRSLIQAGIVEVVYPKDIDVPERWQEGLRDVHRHDGGGGDHSQIRLGDPSEALLEQTQIDPPALLPIHDRTRVVRTDDAPSFLLDVLGCQVGLEDVPRWEGG